MDLGRVSVERIREETISDLAEGHSLGLRGSLGWRHAMGDVTPKASLAFSGGEDFTVAGAPIARYALALDAGIDLSLSDRVSFGAPSAVRSPRTR